jgi:hypothetical protein
MGNKTYKLINESDSYRIKRRLNNYFFVTLNYYLNYKYYHLDIYTIFLHNEQFE